MKNTIGNNVSVTIFGESHGDSIGCVIDGLKAGIKIDLNHIQDMLELRKPKGSISTQRKEQDDFKIVSGLFNAHTTGTPLTIIIENKSQHSKDYEKTKDLLRPSHADYTAFEKYNGFQDYRGGGHFSGRITAPLVAAGAIAIQILKSCNIKIGTHIKNLGNLMDREFHNISEDIDLLSTLYFPVLDEQAKIDMENKIVECANDLDSIGGILETCVINLPTGIGEPFFDSLESILAHYIFSVPGIKGVEFGLGFDFAKHKGSTANDEFIMKDNIVVTKTNNNGGINGGISNGMPIVIKSSVKPTPSIYKEQNTVNYKTRQDEKIKINGRHDPAIIHRARVVIDSVVALAIVDMLCSSNSNGWMK